MTYNVFGGMLNPILPEGTQGWILLLFFTPGVKIPGVENKDKKIN